MKGNGDEELTIAKKRGMAGEPELQQLEGRFPGSKARVAALGNDSRIALSTEANTFSVMALPSRQHAQELLTQHVQDEYQRHHALMVATAVEGYAGRFQGDPELWYLTGLLHDIDFEKHPETHPRESLRWFAEWGYPPELIHAVEAHAYGYNGFTTLPQTKLAAALLATDELCGIFYAYRKLNPLPYGQMKASSIRKKVKEPAFAAKVDRRTIYVGCEHLGVPVDDHIGNVIAFLANFPPAAEN